MEEKKIKYPNKFTVGKYFRRLKGLSKADPSAKEIPPSKSLLEYFQYLTEKGLECKKLGIGSFKTKNDHNYIGLIVKEKVHQNEIFMKLPMNLTLNSKIAYFSDIKTIVDENLEFFIENYWEDTLLIVFLLFENQRGVDSKWYHLITNLPKDIDYLAFWPEKELDLLEDPYLKKKALDDKSWFDKFYAETSEILSKYPNIFKTKESYSYDNVKWIHIHLVTRCFGGNFKYVTMVPFAEFINHECSNVTYSLIYNPENPDKNDGSTYEDIENDGKSDLNDDQRDNFSTSQESNNSEDYVNKDFEDFKFIKPNEIEKLIDEKIISDNELNKEYSNILNWAMNSIDLGDTFSIFYFAEIINSLMEYKKLKSTKEIIEKISELKMINLQYKNRLYQYYSDVMNIEIDKLEFTQKSAFLNIGEGDQDKKSKEDQKEKIEEFKNKKWEDEKYDYIVFHTYKEQFEENSQIYLCYKRMSNRKMLNLYGMALEYNKYDHIYIRIDYTQFFINNSEILNYIASYNLGKIKKFKLKATEININFILFYKTTIWKIKNNSVDELFFSKNLDLEIKAVKLMLNQLETELNHSKYTMEENIKMLSDHQINHHQYFSAVYRIEKQRILETHIIISQVLIEILKRIKEGVKIDDSLAIVKELENEENWQRHRIILKKYLERVLNQIKE